MKTDIKALSKAAQFGDEDTSKRQKGTNQCQWCSKHK